MDYRKRIYGGLLIFTLLFGFSVKGAYAQLIPVVYDRTYGENTDYQYIAPAAKGEVVLVGNANRKTTVTWVQGDGSVIFSKNLTSDFSTINNVCYLGNNEALILGQSNVLKNKKTFSYGRAMIINNAGVIKSNVTVGDDGSALTLGKYLKDGGLVVGGYERRADGLKAGMVAKVDVAGTLVYKYVSNESGACVGFDILGSSTTEYVNAAFTGIEGIKASVVRLDTNGKTLFATNLPDQGFSIKKIVTALDDYIFLIGSSKSSGGRIVKLRAEGDIVFNKEIVPSTEMSPSLDHLYLSAAGNILVGGNGGEKCYYSLLRNDGTDIYKYVLKGSISGMGMNATSGESVIVGFDSERGRGTIIGLARDGRQIYQKATDGNFNKIQITQNGAYLASTVAGRVCMISNTGNLLFDRYAIEETKSSFDDIVFTCNGDILFKGMKNRLVKLAHGLYVSDVRINKPVNGYTTAVFTVTLTGYSTTDQGVPSPVTVDFSTKQGTATEDNNYSPSNGRLSFVPSNDGATRYMINQEVEVPIRANNLMEGRKMFELYLANVSDSYLVKPIGTATIEDQDVVVKMVSVEDGLEDQRDVIYELGIFKTNGESLTNATGSDVVVDGAYGKGTADVLDFDMGVIPRLTISNGSSTGKFNVKTMSDLRYELPKTVVVEFNKIHAINDANIGFEGSLLSCTGNIVDQPAMIAISSLGDHGRMNNIVSGFFKISLLRLSDGAALTNATGGDVVVNCSLSSETTGVEGKDFVLTNLHDLRIWGGGNRSAVNLNGIVLYDKDKLGAKTVSMEIDNVSVPEVAPIVAISSGGKKANFAINE